MIRTSKQQKGFTLVEILVVMGMLGVIMTAIYSLYVTHQRSAYVQEETVDVQQNLRIALDNITRDIKMSGFIIPADINSPDMPNSSGLGYDSSMPVGMIGNGAGPLQPLPAPNNINSDTLTLNMSGSAIARINDDDDYFSVSVSSGTDILFTVDDNSYFTVSPSPVNREVVRIIIPTTRRQADASVNATPVHYTVEAVGNTAAACNPKAPPCLQVRAQGGGGGSVTYRRGYFILKTGYNSAIGPIESWPVRVDYLLVQGPAGTSCADGDYCLGKRVNGGDTQIIANKISGLQFKYRVVGNYAAEFDNPPDLQQIRSVRVDIFGRTTETVGQTGGMAKTRQVTSVANIRNSVYNANR